MPFYTEKTAYVKTSLSDLQGAWENFSLTVLSLPKFHDSERIIFHLNEAMSWENVRNLKNMKNILLLIRNISIKTEHSDILTEDLDQIKDCLDAAIDDFGNI